MPNEEKLAREAKNSKVKRQKFPYAIQALISEISLWSLFKGPIENRFDTKPAAYTSLGGTYLPAESDTYTYVSLHSLSHWCADLQHARTLGVPVERDNSRCREISPPANFRERAPCEVQK